MAVPATFITASAGASSLLHELGDVLEVGVLVLDQELVVRGWNAWLAAASGRPAEEVLGTPLVDVFPDLRGGRAEGVLRRALGGATTVWSQQFHGYLLPLPAPAGHERFPRMQQSVRIMPLMGAAAIEGVLVLVHDVTERVAREEELRKALQDAEGASQAKSDFLAAMSHELRTPLAAIVGYMDLLHGEMVGAVAPLQKTYLGRVRAAAQHLISIIEGILTFSRVDAGKEQLHLEPCDATRLAREVEELFEPQALLKQLVLSIRVPDCETPILTDVTKLRQILINLLGNAVKFTDRGQVALEMRVEDTRVVFTIRDTGPGIGADDMGRIFDAFTQLDQSLRRSKGGTGLGLPVSRKLAHLLGGDLAVESRPGEGTAFTLWLPMRLEVVGYAEPASGVRERVGS